MIEFLTLLLGLVTGPKEVAVAVGSEVATVEILLDGERAAGLGGEPWRAEIDFGPDLVPHELVAVARDGAGTELGRAEQRLNVPRPPAEVSILLERDEGGTVRAALLGWESSVAGGLQEIRLRLDGRDVAVPGGTGAQRIELPATGDEDFHLLEAELEFAGSVIARRQIGFGGHLDRAGSELTAIPVEVTEAERLLEPAALRGWFRRGGEALRVVAVESGPAEVIVVRAPSAATALQRLVGGPGIVAQGRSPGKRLARLQVAFDAAALGPDDRFRMLYPAPRRVIGHEAIHEVFPVTPPIGAGEGGIYWHGALELENEEKIEPRLADAVAVAGNQAAAGGNRRAVVLIVGPQKGAAASRYSPAQARRYLAELRVPLYVWYLGREKHAPAEWEDAVAIGSFARFDREVAALGQRLDRQRVVWVDGSHLPRSITLSADAAGLRLLD